MFEIRNLTVNYGDMRALSDVGFAIEENEIVCLVGSNGAGKTTIINAISGIVPVQTGSIRLLEHQVELLPSHKRVELGLVQVPEGRRIFPKLSVLENLRAGSIIPIARSRRAETLEAVFEFFPILRERTDQKAGTLSGGEQQMLAIGRALMAHPKLLMLDEPSLGVAPIVVKGIFEVLKQININGTTLLLVEQNVQLALSFCHRAYVLENGRVILSGEGQELLRNQEIKRAYLGL